MTPSPPAFVTPCWAHLAGRQSQKWHLWEASLGLAQSQHIQIAGLFLMDNPAVGFHNPLMRQSEGSPRPKVSVSRCPES